MKVMCLYTGGVPELTQDKIYEVEYYTSTNNYIKVFNDEGEPRNYKSVKFKLLDEVRSDKIDQILI